MILAPHAMSVITLLKMCQICVSRARVPKPRRPRASDPCQNVLGADDSMPRLMSRPIASLFSESVTSLFVTCLPVRWPMKSSGEFVKARERGWLGELGALLKIFGWTQAQISIPLNSELIGSHGVLVKPATCTSHQQCRCGTPTPVFREALEI